MTLTNPGTVPASQAAMSGLAGVDPVLLALDPDLEALFAEVEAALIRARVPATPATAIATADTGSGTEPRPWPMHAPVHAHRPRTGRASQRGPPPGRGFRTQPHRHIPK